MNAFVQPKFLAELRDDIVQAFFTQIFTPYFFKQLFACGYLSFKDFVSLPYTFTVCDPRPGQVPNDTCKLSVATGTNTPIVVVKGAAGSGDKYDVSKNKDYLIYVDQSMKVKDSSK